MSNKKIKKKIKLYIFLLVFVLIIFLIILQIMRLNSKEKILKMLVSGMDNLNYTSESNGLKIQIVGKQEKIIDLETKYETYNDYETKKTKKLYPDSYFMEEYKNNGIKNMSYYKDCISPYFENEDYNYKYVGKKELNGKKCILVKFVFKDKSREIYIWIDNSTKVIAKIGKYIDNAITNEKEAVFEKEYDFTSGSNRIEDVKITKEELSKYSTETDD